MDEPKSHEILALGANRISTVYSDKALHRRLLQGASLDPLERSVLLALFSCARAFLAAKWYGKT